VADGQGLGGGEHEGRQVLAAEPGGLVQAVADVDEQLPGRLPAGTGLGGEDDRLAEGWWSWRTRG
jgi:hypothetical protein